VHGRYDRELRPFDIKTVDICDVCREIVQSSESSEVPCCLFDRYFDREHVRRRSAGARAEMRSRVRHDPPRKDLGRLRLSDDVMLRRCDVRFGVTGYSSTKNNAKGKC
jgi:hypothetical protein